jgi:hypothetical protein
MQTRDFFVTIRPSRLAAAVTAVCLVALLSSQAHAIQFVGFFGNPSLTAPPSSTDGSVSNNIELGGLSDGFSYSGGISFTSSATTGSQVTVQFAITQLFGSAAGLSNLPAGQYYLGQSYGLSFSSSNAGSSAVDSASSFTSAVAGNGTGGSITSNLTSAQISNLASPQISTSPSYSGVATSYPTSFTTTSGTLTQTVTLIFDDVADGETINITLDPDESYGVPEPATAVVWGLLITGAVGVAVIRRARRARAR